jgi:hypothetical protein
MLLKCNQLFCKLSIHVQFTHLTVNINLGYYWEMCVKGSRDMLGNALSSYRDRLNRLDLHRSGVVEKDRKRRNFKIYIFKKLSLDFKWAFDVLKKPTLDAN